MHSHFNHDNDTEDVAEDQDPIELRKKAGGRNPGTASADSAQMLVQAQDDKREKDANEVQELIQEQKEEDKQEMAAINKRDHEKQMAEIEAAKTRKEREETKDVDQQIANYVKNWDTTKIYHARWSEPHIC